MAGKTVYQTQKSLIFKGKREIGSRGERQRQQWQGRLHLVAGNARLAKHGDRNDVARKSMKKTDPPRTGLFGDKDGTMKLPPDNNDAAALALTAFGYNDPGNADEGVPELVEL